MMKTNLQCCFFLMLLWGLAGVAQALTLPQTPLSDITKTPLILLTSQRDHSLFYEAYNDASDLDGDGTLELHYKPAIKYYGYFDSYKCYDYVSSGISSGSILGGFVPQRTTTDKTCSGNWSGDFLNYLTTSRMDALRRVLYGGKRVVDSISETVLERAYIPQEAHSWAKEYTSTAIDGFDIAKYTPLTQPVTGKKHLFANVTVSCLGGGGGEQACITNPNDPLLRVASNSVYRNWQWVSIDSPVAGEYCAAADNSRTKCAEPTFSAWQVVPTTNFRNLTKKTYAKPTGTTSPTSKAGFDSYETTYAIDGNLKATTNPTQIDYRGNTSAVEANIPGLSDYFIDIITGDLYAPVAGYYTFGVDGDDAIDFYLGGVFRTGWYGAHAFCGSNPSTNATSCAVNGAPAPVSIYLSKGWHSIKVRQDEFTNEFGARLWWKTPSDTTSNLTDYAVRVKVCVDGLLEAGQCGGYPVDNPTVYKPVGILQQFGENDRMAFGLLTGSYAHHLSGGVIRKNVSSFTDEISPTDGTLTATKGIIKTLDAIKIVGFGETSRYYYRDDSNSCTNSFKFDMVEGCFQSWGNPIAEMMYEGLRYFAGKSGPTTEFTYSTSDATLDDNKLGLPLPTWKDPYKSVAAGGGGFSSCSKPSQIVISDTLPNFDTDQIPGRYTYTKPTDLTALAFSGDQEVLNATSSGATINAKALGDTIWTSEYGANATKSFFIGQSEANYDLAPTAKSVKSFGSMRGLAPDEPTKHGGYYAGSVALYGKTTDLNPAAGDQKTDTFSITMAPTTPHMSVPVNGKTITVVPLGRTVAPDGCGAGPNPTDHQLANAILDFYVASMDNFDPGAINSSINGGRPHALFLVNFADVETGAYGFDLDSAAKYELTVKPDKTLDVTISLESSATGCLQHLGYTIGGTTQDGTYFDIFGKSAQWWPNDTVDYYLDTPNEIGKPLPVTNTRNFTAGGASASFVDHDPLWYAAKWGGFVDINKNNALDNDLDGVKEWDNRNGADGVPDTYFLVTNATYLRDQLDRTFTELLARESSSASVAANSGELQIDSRLYQPKYKTTDWSGQLQEYQVNASGIITLEWDAGVKVNSQSDSNRVIITKGSTGDGVGFTYANLTGNSTTNNTQKYYLDRNASGTQDNCGPERVAYLRGSATNEATVGSFTCASGAVISTFRQRSSKLGDIVNSSPWHVGEPSLGLSDVEAPGYNAFRRGKFGRKPVVYVGANDGMLHGFDASLNYSSSAVGVPTTTAGQEVLGFVPSQVYKNLSKLTARSYIQNHQFYVDGSPIVGDANLGNDTTPDWRTVLVGGLGAGGKGYYALDVSDPASFSEANAASIFLWEFDDTTDADDMGYVYNLPPADTSTRQAKQIVKMANGKWAVVLGNGYNSKNGKAVLYIVFINNGVDGIWTASTDYVKLVASSVSGVDNGLSTPVPFDSNDDGMVDVIYAGDLQGNVWKFAVGDANPDNWKVDFSTTTTACGSVTPSTCLPLFTAKDNATTPKAQPILTPPEVTLHPVSGLMVMVGTGKFLETSDATNLDYQAFYGLWDKNDGTTRITSKADDLLKQEFSLSTNCPNPRTSESKCIQTTSDGKTLRLSTSRAINWRTSGNAALASCTPVATCKPSHLGWYVDYLYAGERTTGKPRFDGGIIFINTYLPGSATCEDARGFQTALDYASGGMDTYPIFTSDGSGVVAASIETIASIGGGTYLSTNTTTSATTSGGGLIMISGVNATLGKQEFLLYLDKLKGRLNWQEIIPVQ